VIRKVSPMIRVNLTYQPGRAALAVAACLFAAGVASPAALAWPFGPAPVKVTPAALPPPPAPPPAVELSDQALTDAAAFRAYVKHAETISAAFTSGEGVEQSLAVGAAYEPQQLARGAIAYAALLALQDPSFVNGVRAYAVDPTQRHELAQRLASDPRYAEAFPGADRAAGLIMDVMGVESTRISGVAAQVKQSAYSVQHSAWSKTKVVNPDGRLAQTKALSAAIMNGEAGDVDQLRHAIDAGENPTDAQVLGARGEPVPGPYAPVVERGLALAALAALGEAGDENTAAISAIETEPKSGACLALSKLNLYQCLAVAVPWYEDIFCLGEHALGETAQCLSKDAGDPAQLREAMAPPPTALATPATAAVPTSAVGAPVASQALASQAALATAATPSVPATR
jgi:hypothetical protein